MIKYLGLVCEEARGCSKRRTAMVFRGNFRGAYRFTRQLMLSRVIVPLARAEAKHSLAFSRTTPMCWFGFVKWVMETHGEV